MPEGILLRGNPIFLAKKHSKIWDFFLDTTDSIHLKCSYACLKKFQFFLYYFLIINVVGNSSTKFR